MTKYIFFADKIANLSQSQTNISLHHLATQTKGDFGIFIQPLRFDSNNIISHWIRRDETNRILPYTTCHGRYHQVNKMAADIKKHFYNKRHFVQEITINTILYEILHDSILLSLFGCFIPVLV